MTTIFVLLFYFHVAVFLISALVAVIRFNIDLHRYKQKFNFAGRRNKFIDYLLQKSLNETPEADQDNHDREVGETNDS